jgi:hypothetical protein
MIRLMLAMISYSLNLYDTSYDTLLFRSADRWEASSTPPRCSVQSHRACRSWIVRERSERNEESRVASDCMQICPDIWRKQIGGPTFFSKKVSWWTTQAQQHAFNCQSLWRICRALNRWTVQEAASRQRGTGTCEPCHQHKDPAGPTPYPLQPIILFTNIDISKHILVVDIFILLKINIDRREYLSLHGISTVSRKATTYRFLFHAEDRAAVYTLLIDLLAPRRNSDVVSQSAMATPTGET